MSLSVSAEYYSAEEFPFYGRAGNCHIFSGAPDSIGLWLLDESLQPERRGFIDDVEKALNGSISVVKLCGYGMNGVRVAGATMFAMT